MYVARFSYNIKPTDRERALSLLAQEVKAARDQGMQARLLVPLTRAAGGAALQFEVELDSLDAFDQYRDQGLGSADETRAWLRDLSEILLEPPAVELLRADDGGGESNRRSLRGDAEASPERKGLIGGNVHKA
jgi:hypothetical protein